MDKIKNALRLFVYYKSLADRAIAQLSEEELFVEPAPGSNSIAVIMKHMSGNMISRWTDLFTTDGEKDWRNRDSEFEIEKDEDISFVKTYWEKGWNVLFDTLKNIKPDQVDQKIVIRKETHSLDEALSRQLCHYAYHVGQIVDRAKCVRGRDFESLSIARGMSRQYNAKKSSAENKKRHFTDDL